MSFPSPFGTADGYAYNVAAGARVAVITDGGRYDANVAMAEAIARRTGRTVDLVLTAGAAASARSLHDHRSVAGAATTEANGAR